MVFLLIWYMRQPKTLGDYTELVLVAKESAHQILAKTEECAKRVMIPSHVIAGQYRNRIFKVLLVRIIFLIRFL